MKIRTAILFGVLGGATLLAMAGCDTALVVKDKVVGVSSGKFYYTDGAMRTDYAFSMDQVRAAAKATLVELKATDLREQNKIALTTMDCVVSDEKVHLEVEYGSRMITYVSVRAGVAGNQMASKMILDRIKKNLETAGQAEGKL
jgi:hypothetical protein